MTEWERVCFAREQRGLQRAACRQHLMSVTYGGSGIERPEGISGARWSAMLNHYKREIGIDEANRSYR